MAREYVRRRRPREGVLRAGACGLALALGPWLAASQAPVDADADCRAALELAYDGSTGNALAQLEALVAARPDDLLCAYVELLARVWALEQAPQDEARERDFHSRAERLIARAETRLRVAPDETRTRFVLGAAWGARSRLHLSRVQKTDAARSAVKMRAALLDVPEKHPLYGEALFGLGLYDYYADVLPRVLKLLRFLVRFPGGDRERGLRAIETAERLALLHHTEIRAQLFDIYAFYEERHDDALERLLALRRRYPGAPLWGLRLADHQRERLGLYAESAETAREVLEAAERGHPNYAPVVGLMARVGLGEALLADLRPADARAAVLPAREGAILAPWIAARARLMLGRSLELEGDRAGALVHYRAAAHSADRHGSELAERALVEPIPRQQVRAFPLLAAARRALEAGHGEAADDGFRRALAAWPDSDEARLRVAQSDLARGRLEVARRTLESLDARERPDPPWVRPWARLLLARLRDAAGRRSDALSLYNDVYQHPLGSPSLRRAAQDGLRQPWRPPAPPSPSPRPVHHAR